MSLLTRRTASTLAVALLAVGGLTGCNDDKPATTPSPTPTESSMVMSESPSEDSMMSDEPSEDSMMSETP